MNELIKTSAAVIGGEEQRTVNARDLWKALQSKRQFGNWIEDRLSGFVEGQDFTINKIVKTGKGASGKQLYKEYIITLDVAKHLAMLERNEHGRKIRDYFIEVEKEFRRQANANMELIQIVRENERLRIKYEFARHFLPNGKPGELNENGQPKNQYRRGYYTAGKGNSITALVERAEQPGLFDEIELKKL